MTNILWLLVPVGVAGMALVLAWLCKRDLSEELAESDVPEDELECERCGRLAWHCICSDPPGGEG